MITLIILVTVFGILGGLVYRFEQKHRQEMDRLNRAFDRIFQEDFERRFDPEVKRELRNLNQELDRLMHNKKLFGRKRNGSLF